MGIEERHPPLLIQFHGHSSPPEAFFLEFFKKYREKGKWVLRDRNGAVECRGIFTESDVGNGEGF